jgi:hypothetical protein
MDGCLLSFLVLDRAMDCVHQLTYHISQDVSCHECGSQSEVSFCRSDRPCHPIEVNSSAPFLLHQEICRASALIVPKSAAEVAPENETGSARHSPMPRRRGNE